MTSRELMRWAALHRRRERSAKWWSSELVGALGGGAVIAAWVAWRMDTTPTVELASRAWLLACIAAFGVAFLRVPFQLYWRSDSALLAQLPVEGGPLFDVALVRCVRSAVATVVAVAIGALPLFSYGVDVVARHLALVGLLGVAAAAFVPATVIYAASIVATGIGTDARAAAANASQVLGAIPGGLGAVVIVLVLLIAPWLTGGVPHLPVSAVVVIVVGGSVAALGVARGLAAKSMGRILRDVAALDRQRLAMLEIRPPTGLERAIGSLAGAGRIVYAKDARLVRRRYPLAFALGAASFLALVILAVAAPDELVMDATIILGGCALYGVVMAGRLERAPLELSRLIPTLPLASADVRRAKLVWLGGWWCVFLVGPAVAVAVRAPLVFGVLGLATAVLFGGARLRQARR